MSSEEHFQLLSVMNRLVDMRFIYEEASRDARESGFGSTLWLESFGLLVHICDVDNLCSVRSSCPRMIAKHGRCLDRELRQGVNYRSSLF